MNSNIMDWVAMIRIDDWYVDRIIGYILCNLLSRIFHKDFNIKGRIWIRSKMICYLNRFPFVSEDAWIIQKNGMDRY